MTQPSRWRAVVVLGLCGVAGMPSAARGQGDWEATLFVTPFPSPYLSDWETNPNIATYTLINGTGREQEVILRYEVRNQAGTMVTAGHSDPQPIAAGAPAIYTSFTDIAGSTQHDQVLEDQVQRTGRMPEGDYTACVVAISISGFVLAQACESFTVLYPDPPMLVAPADGELVSTAAPIFQWTPLQVPADYTLHFVLQVAEVRPDQTPFTALTANILQYENLDVGATSLTYPVDGLPLLPGRDYAWRVVAIDQNGYAASSNDGSSEIWSFHYDDGTGGGGTPGATPITLSVRNDPDSPSVTPPEDDETTGLLQICSEWSVDRPVQAIWLPVASRILFPSETTVPAGLIRKELGNGQRVWAILGTRDPFTLVAYGDCDGPLEKTVLRWVGARRTSDAQELGAWLGGPVLVADSSTVPEDTAGAKLKFGVGVFTLHEMTVTGDSLEPVREFLEDHSFDVQPGFNFYGVVDGTQVPALSALADVLHTTTKDFELQGFAGLNMSHSVGLSLGATPGPGTDSPAFRRFGAGADVSTEVIILWLRGALPKWENPWGWDKVSSIQLGLEVVVKDSIAYGVGREPGLANTFETVITPVLTVETAGGVTWRGAAGADFEGTTPKFIINLSSDAQWRPGPLAGSPFYLGNPEIQLDIYKGLIDAIRQGDAGLIDWNLDLSASLGVGNEGAVAELGVTVGRKADDPEKYWSTLAAKDSAQAEGELLLIRLSQERLDQAEARGDTAAAAYYRQELERRSTLLDETLQNLKNAQRGLELTKQHPPDRAHRLDSERGAWWWRARLSFGNMSLIDFIDLVRKAAGGGL